MIDSCCDNSVSPEYCNPSPVSVTSVSKMKPLTSGTSLLLSPVINLSLAGLLQLTLTLPLPFKIFGRWGLLLWFNPDSPRSILTVSSFKSIVVNRLFLWSSRSGLASIIAPPNFRAPKLGNMIGFGWDLYILIPLVWVPLIGKITCFLNGTFAADWGDSSVIMLLPIFNNCNKLHLNLHQNYVKRKHANYVRFKANPKADTPILLHNT